MVADIDTAALIHRLQAFALGSDDNLMSEQQVAAASALLNRVLPDLHHVDLRTGGQPILLTVAETASGGDTSTK